MQQTESLLLQPQEFQVQNQGTMGEQGQIQKQGSGDDCVVLGRDPGTI
jgi:hypothetical protein